MNSNLVVYRVWLLWEGLTNTTMFFSRLFWSGDLSLTFTPEVDEE